MGRARHIGFNGFVTRESRDRTRIGARRVKRPAGLSRRYTLFPHDDDASARRRARIVSHRPATLVNTLDGRERPRFFSYQQCFLGFSLARRCRGGLEGARARVDGDFRALTDVSRIAYFTSVWRRGRHALKMADDAAGR